MKYLCTNCRYTFDEALGDIGEDISYWTKIDSIEKCPVCDEYDTFHHIEEEVNYIETDTCDTVELNHYIEAEKIDERLSVTIWANLHPMWENHRIAWVWLYDDEEDLIEEKFFDIEEEPTVFFEDFDLDIFEIRIKCSQHHVFWKKFEI